MSLRWMKELMVKWECSLVNERVNECMIWAGAWVDGEFMTMTMTLLVTPLKIVFQKPLQST